ADVRQVDDHADPVHLGDDLPAEPGQAGVGRLVATAAHVVLDVVGELRDPYSQIGEKLNEPDTAGEERTVLEAEQDGSPVAGGQSLDVRGRSGDADEVAVLPFQVPPRGEGVERFEGVAPVSACHGHTAEPALAKFGEHLAVELAAFESIYVLHKVSVCNACRNSEHRSGQGFGHVVG